ncbi:MAG TPA: DUF488 domain-containing protein [Candidatus Cybelea sp.]|nr:DUF488 domain-containing protein [Candidatus Cybelea sp.]
MDLFTFGHGTAGEVELAALIRGAGIQSVVDVRSVPKSRAHPHVWMERMATWMPDLSGASYRWSPGLGGFRKPHSDSPNVALRHASFRAYADYMQTEPFLRVLDELVQTLEKSRTAIMCSEGLWWRCHRRLIADAATLLRGVDVRHIMHAGTIVPHRVTDGVRVLPEGILQYDGESARC